MKLKRILPLVLIAVIIVLFHTSAYAQADAAAGEQWFGVTGTVTGVSKESITVLSKEKKRTFLLDGTKITYSGGILPDDIVKIIYSSADRKKAYEIRMITPSKAHANDIYDIKGTAKSIYGASWDNMLAWRRGAKQYAGKYRGVVSVNKTPVEKVVYLTFDDGPDAVNTPSIINTLVKYKAGGTFFFTGTNMLAHKSVVKSAYDKGFAIGLHGYDHTRFSALSETGLKNDINKTNNVFYGITGKYSGLTRPPYGDMNDSVINTLSSMDQQVVLWSTDTLDWAQKDSSEILRNIKDNLRPGEIILMHSGQSGKLSAQVLPQIIEYIRSQGYELANLPERKDTGDGILS